MKKPKLFRSLAILGLVLTGAAGAWWGFRAAGLAGADEARAAVTLEEQSLGDKNAPVTVIEYASFTCPHCANFHRDVWPALIERYINTGKARIVFRDYPLDPVALRAAMLTHCVDRNRYFGFVKLLLMEQENWAFAADPLPPLKQRAKLAGLSDAKIEACLGDKDLEEAIMRRAYEGQQAFGVSRTPTLIINGRKLEGPRSVDQVARIIDNQLKR